MTSLETPYAKAMGLIATRDETGRLIITAEFENNKMGRPGYWHGGAIAGMLEVAAYAVLADVLGEDPAPRLKPVNVTVTYMRAGREKPVYASAIIERLGRRVANVEASAWQDDPAKPIAMAQINVLIDRTDP
jgi:uncharacterized protein (TIGR00369 family)